jgi:hypothetical protein
MELVLAVLAAIVGIVAAIYPTWKSAKKAPGWTFSRRFEGLLAESCDSGLL